MSGLFASGFDFLGSVSQLTEGIWTSGSGFSNFQTGRFSGQAVRIGSNLSSSTKTLPSNYATLIAGFAIKMVTAGTTRFFAFRDGATNEQVGLALNGSNQLIAYRGSVSTVLGTGSTALSTGVWYWIEIKATFNGATGAVEVRLNGTTEINQSGIDTTQSANNFANVIVIGCGGANWDWDDLYVCDNSGSVNNDFLGICRIQTVTPSGAGSSTQFTPSAGSNYQHVDDATPDDDSTYNSTSTSGHIDLYAMGDLTGTPTVHFVQTAIRARMDDAGPRSIREKCKSGATTANGTTRSLTANYAYYIELRDVDPNTSAKFTASNFNNAEFGVENI